MTKYSYTTPEDQKLIDRSLNNLTRLIFGRNGEKSTKVFKRIFDKKVKRVNVYPQGTITPRISSRTPGICRLDDNGYLIIEMLGYSGASPDQYPFIQHEGTHEFCHAFADLLPLFCTEFPDGIIKEGIKCECHMGMIKETNPETGELVHQHYYGKMYNETMMDIISTIAINYFDNPSTTKKTADEVLTRPHTEWCNATTSYSIFTSLTRLTIAAFSNNGFINYDKVIKAGGGIFDVKTKMHSGEERYANDFLYGILFDPLHIEKEFDKFMGEGYYRTFCEYLDRLFQLCLDKQQIPAEEVKRVMNILPDFLNKKMAYYLEHNIVTKAEADRIVGNFNRIWNSMQIEYSSYFSQEEIQEIAKRAGK